MNEKDSTSLAPGERWIWIMAKAHAGDQRPDVYVGRARTEGLSLDGSKALPNRFTLKVSPFVRVENSAPTDASRWHAIGSVLKSYDLAFDGCAIDKKRTAPDRIVIGSSLGDTIILSLREEDAKIICPLLGPPPR